MAIKYPIRKRIRKGPRIVNRGSGITPTRNPKPTGGKPPVRPPTKRRTHRPSLKGVLSMGRLGKHSGGMTPNHARGGGHGARLKQSVRQEERL